MKIAFCKYGGLAAGGTEKYLQSLALLYNKAGHQIDYYYTDATPIEGTDWKHPDTCPGRRQLLKSAGINTRFAQVQRRGHAAGGSEWIGTNGRRNRGHTPTGRREAERFAISRIRSPVTQSP